MRAPGTFEDSDGCQPIHYASCNNQRHIVEWLVLEMGVKLDARDWRGGTPLHDASSRGSLATVQWIVEYDSDLVALRANNHPELKPTHRDATPLRIAELEGQEAVVRYLKASPYYVRAAQEAEKAAEAMAAQLILEEEKEKEKAAKKKKGEAQSKAKAKKKGGKGKK